ncbi:hypothetical protein NDK43_05440 [Neobacillus pocheonensis]|uniref:Uncharacterized protein n=1 Tax=Neobacillus pocheonensis TaxID=363869 RepID=A0ABT0W6G9_9BACI|nr:hypothetical protein [Neobacillus pocheonensis]
MTLSNQKNQTLRATVRIDQVVFPLNPIYPLQPVTVLLPPTNFNLPPNTAAGINVPLFIDTGGTSAAASSDPRALIVTVSGDVEKSGDKILVSVTGGFSSNGSSFRCLRADYVLPT